MEDTYNSDDEREKNRKLFSAIYKNKKKKVEQLLNSVKINIVDRHNKKNTPLHYAIERGETEIITLLVDSGADTTIKNVNNKTPLELAMESKNVDVIKALTYKINVPSDGSCLFWAAALSYLTPVKCQQTTFEERVGKLFGSISSTQLEQVQEFMKNYDPFSNSVDCIEEIRSLVTQSFRNRVIDEMFSHKSKFEDAISVHDFSYSRNVDYIVDGTFQKKFLGTFSSHERCHICIDKLKPSELNKDTLEEIVREFDKIQDKDKIKRFLFESYLECMRDSKAWGGEHEIQAIRQLLLCNICVVSNRIQYSIDYDNNLNKQIILFNNGEVHYEFGLVRSTELVETKRSNRQPKDHIDHDQRNWDNYNKNIECYTAHNVVPQSAGGNKMQAGINAKDNGSRSDCINSSPPQNAQQVSKNLQSGSLQGGDFELCLIMLFIINEMHKCESNGKHSFFISSQESTSEKLDDVVLKYRDNEDEKYKCHFLQAKHQSTSVTNITENILLKPHGNYSLLMYFNAYLEINQNKKFMEDVVEYIIFATNKNLQFEKYHALKKLKNSDFYFKEIDLKDCSLRVGSCKLYRFDQNQFKKDKVVSALMQALEFSSLCHSPPKKKKRYGMSEEAHKNASTDEQEKVLELVKKLNPTELKNKIELFLEKLIFAVNLPKEKELEEFVKDNIKSKLSMFKDIDDVDMIFRNFKSRVADVRKKPKVEPLSYDDCKKIFQEIVQGIAKSALKPSYIKNDINFKEEDNLQYLQDFLRPPKQILNLITSKKDKDGSIIENICTYFNTVRDCTKKYFSNLPKAFQVKVLKLETRIYLFMIHKSGNSKPESSELYDKISDIIIKTTNAKIILITDGNDHSKPNSFSKLFKRKFLPIYTEIPVKIFNYRLHEKDVRDFLALDKQVFNLVSQLQETALSTHKTLQTLARIPPTDTLNYKKSGTFILSDLNSLIEDRKEQICLFSAFESETNPHLFVIECKESKSSKQEITQIHNKLSKILRNCKKKIVLITREEDALAAKFKINFSTFYLERKDEKNSFTDLTVESQNELLKTRTVIFQGKEVRLDTLINAKSEYLIKDDILSKLVINKETIEIGKEISGFGNVEDYYIERKFNRKTINKECLKASLPDLFAISGTDQNKLSKLVGGNERVRKFEDKDFDRNDPIRFIILDCKNARENFEKLCVDYPNYNIHWLKQWSGRVEPEGQSALGERLMWQKSNRSLSNLLNYVDDKMETETYPEEDFLKMINDKDDNKVVIISAEPGMGKSTVMTSLTKKLKTDALWVIRVDLFSLYIKLANFDSSETNVVDFLVNVLDLKDETLGKQLFKHRLEQGGIIFLFDGFDEITSDSKEKVMHVLKYLKSTETKRIFVSTRGYMQNELVDTFCTLPYNLELFSECNQNNFLYRFWDFKEIILDEKQLEKLEDKEKSKMIIVYNSYMYIDILLDSFSKSIADKNKTFTGTPLFLRMLAEIYKVDYQVFSYAKKLPSLPIVKEDCLLTLYAHFVDKKYNIFQQGKLKKDIRIPGMEKDLERGKETFLTNHKLLAMQSLFSENDILTDDERKQIQDLIEEIKKPEYLYGLLNKVTVEDKPDFVHLSFAEYFVEELVTEKLKSGPSTKLWEFLIRDIFFENYRNVRKFFEEKLKTDKVLVKSISSHKETVLKLMLEENEKCSRPFLCVAVEEDLEKCVEFLLSCVGDIDMLLQMIDTPSDTNSSVTPLRLAVCCDCLTIIDLFLKLVKELDEDKLLEVICIALYVAVENDRNVIEYILSSYIDITDHDKIKNIFSWRNEKIDGKTVMQLAAEKGSKFIHHNIREYVKDFNTEERLLFFNTADRSNKTPAHYAFESGNFDFFILLHEILPLDQFREVYTATNDKTLKHELLCLAVENHNDEITNILLKDIENADDILEVMNFVKINKGGKTLLHRAALSYNMKIFLKYIKQLNLHQRVTVLSATDDSGRTPAHYAAENKNFDFLYILYTDLLNPEHTRNVDVYLSNLIMDIDGFSIAESHGILISEASAKRIRDLKSMLSVEIRHDVYLPNLNNIKKIIH